MDMENKEKQNIELPENAFRELKEGEEYQPVMSPNKVYPEVSTWSVTWGLVMVVLFSAAAAYLGLKVGQVFEAAIPIAIIAIGMSSATKRKNALGPPFTCSNCKPTSSKYSLQQRWAASWVFFS